MARVNDSDRFCQLLRSTLPLLLELETIKSDSNIARSKITSSPSVTIVLKGAAWFRIMYNFM